MQEKKTERAPGGYEDFVAYLGTVRTEEELFSPLTYWFVGQNCPCLLYTSPSPRD